MPKLDFQINKPVDVSEENLTDVVNDIYDCINRLASSTDKFITKSLPSNEPPSADDKFKIVDDQDAGEVKISVNVDGVWYTTSGLTREE